MDVPLIREEKKEDLVHSGQKEFSEGFINIISEHLTTHHRGTLKLEIPVTVKLNKIENDISKKIRDLYLATAREQMESFKPANPKDTYFSHWILCVPKRSVPNSMQVNFNLIVHLTVHPKN